MSSGQMCQDEKGLRVSVFDKMISCRWISLPTLLYLTQSHTNFEPNIKAVPHCNSLKTLMYLHKKCREI